MLYKLVEHNIRSKVKRGRALQIALLELKGRLLIIQAGSFWLFLLLSLLQLAYFYDQVVFIPLIIPITYHLTSMILLFKRIS